jgi:prophage DNA circulation protein
MKAHDAMVDECAKAARDNREPVIPTLNTLTETALIMVICYVRRRNRAMMESHIWMRSPLLTTGDAKKEVKPIEGASKETLEQMSYTQSGNGKTWSLNLSDKARATVMGDNKPFLHPKPRL